MDACSPGKELVTPYTFCVCDVKKSTEHVVDVCGGYQGDPLTLLSPLTEVESLARGTHLWGDAVLVPHVWLPPPFVSTLQFSLEPTLACRAWPTSLRPQGWLFAAHLPRCSLCR